MCRTARGDPPTLPVTDCYKRRLAERWDAGDSGRGTFLERDAEDGGERRRCYRPHLVHGHRPPELARHRRERISVEPACSDPIRERRGIEIDVERVAVRRDPFREVNADRGDLPGRTLQPNPCQPLDGRSLQRERAKRLRNYLFEIPAVLLHILA